MATTDRGKRRARVRLAWGILRGRGTSLIEVDREQRHHVEDVLLEAVEQLHALSDAAWFVPVKQRDRTAEQQVRVEAFTTAVMETREWLQDRGMTPPTSSRANTTPTSRTFPRKDHS